MTELVTPHAALIGTWEPGSPQWHAARAHRIGGSEIAAILGLSPWESSFSLWHRKTGVVGDIDDNPQMSWGRRLEKPIAEAFAENHPELHVDPAGTYVHTERDYQLANPDRLLRTAPTATPDAVLEIKTARDETGWGAPGTDEIPVYYRTQVLWYLDCLGLSRAHIAVLIAGSDYREYVIDLADVDPVEIATLRAEADLFMHSVRTSVRPDIDGSTATYQVVKALPDGVIDEDVELDPKTADDYMNALTAFRAADREKRRMTSLVLDRIGDCRRAMCMGERVATRVVSPNGTTRSLQPARKKD